MNRLLDDFFPEKSSASPNSLSPAGTPAPSAESPVASPPPLAPALPMSELEIRKTLRATVTAEAKGTVAGAVEEFWVPGIHVRADLVVIGKDLHAYEIKSHRDTLKRLPRQVDGFSSLFDRCSLVVAPRHLDAAADQIPEWWGLAIVDEGQLQWDRTPTANPSVDVERVVRLLWRDEVLAMLEEAGIAPDYVGGRAGMWRQVLAAFDPATIRDAVRGALGSRAAWREEAGKSRFTATPEPAR